MEAFRKLQQLRGELERGVELVRLGLRREQAKRELLHIADDQFRLAMHKLVDTSGKRFIPPTLKHVRRPPILTTPAGWDCRCVRWLTHIPRAVLLLGFFVLFRSCNVACVPPPPPPALPHCNQPTTLPAGCNSSDAPHP